MIRTGLWTILASTAFSAATAVGPHDLDACQLHAAEADFVLECPPTIISERVLIPRQWLGPVGDPHAAEESVVSSFRFDEGASAFRIGKGLVGIHVSSFDIQKEGSLQAAAGRDVFFVYESSGRELRRAGLELGVTKSRHRNQGCFSALFHRFYIADVDGDGFLDLGVQRDELKCIPWVDEKEDKEGMDGPFFCREPIRWHLFDGRSWRSTPTTPNKAPDAQLELPLLGIGMSPVDYVRQFESAKPCRDQRGE